MNGLVRAITFVGLLCAGVTIHAATLNVGKGATYAKIQDAINAASSGDVINVAVGTYKEDITLRAGITLTLTGAETARTFLKAASSTGPVIAASGVTNNRISRFTFIESTTGIQTSNSSSLTITGNVFSLGSAGTAVNVTGTADTSTITNNTFYLNKLAISRGGSGVTIQNNIFVSNTTAIPSTDVATGISYNQFFANTSNGQAGTSAITASDPLFVSPADRDFHLKTTSSAIDAGTGTDTDLIDGSTADLGAYGGAHADPTPFPVKNVVISDSTATAPSFSVTVSWPANESYLTGSYTLHYYIEGQIGAVAYNGTEATIPGASGVNVGNIVSVDMSGTAPSFTDTILAPALTSITPQSQALKLSWNRVDNATSYNVRYGVTAADENIVTAGNVSSYTLSGLTNGVTYLVAVVGVRQPILHLAVKVLDNAPVTHMGDYSAEATKTLGVAATSGTSNILTGIPEEVVAFPALPNEGCFIATAAYGSYSAAQVKTLRDFRDHYLLTNAPGRAFVGWYYANSPPAAHYLNQHPALKPVVRGMLLPFVFITSWINYSTLAMRSAVVVLALGLLGLGFYWRRRTSWA